MEKYFLLGRAFLCRTSVIFGGDSYDNAVVNIHLFISFVQPLTYGDRVIFVYLGQYYGCWCHASLRRQDISNQDIDYVE